MKTIAVILAGGEGTRVGGNLPKQFLLLNNKEILTYSLEIFDKSNRVDEIVLVINEKYYEDYLEIINKYKISKISALVCGGKTRQDSVKNAIDSISKNNEEAIVLVHDAARPFVDERIINDNIDAVIKYNCCTTAIKSSNSIYLTENGSFMKEVNRDTVYIAQTPQSAYLSIFKKGFEIVDEIFTDEAAIFSKLGYNPHIVIGDEKNKKITYSEDIKNYVNS